MTTFTITNCSNESLLQAFVKNASDGDSITFACSGTIALTSTLVIKKKGPTAGHLILDGNGESVILDGGNTVRVLLVDGMRLTLKGLTIANGKTDESGGGLLNKGGEVTMANCTFTGNSARHGGGLLNDGGKVMITNCTFCGNSALAWGGGLYNNFGEATVTHCTFTENTATIAGGLAGMGHLTLRATIVAHNTASSSWPNGGGQVTSLGFNLVSGALDGFPVVPTDQHNTDPKFEPKNVQGKSGPTLTIALQAGSPAIGAVADVTPCPDTDQRGWLRPSRITSCDIGAYQSSYLVPPASTPPPSTGAQPHP